MNAQIFREHAPQYAARGLTVFPVGGEDGKRPLVRSWQKFGPQSFRRLLNNSRFDAANIGVLDGTKIVRVDIDDCSLVDMAEERFGPTPVKVGTPSGGIHFWYRSSGEPRILGLDNLKIDILGLGGFGVAPPSRHPSGRDYRFVAGGLGDMGQLPPIKAGALPERWHIDPGATIPNDADLVREGRRNRFLFAKARRLALTTDAKDEVLFRLECWNNECDPPLLTPELERIVHSVWNYKRRGRLIVGRQAVELAPDLMYSPIFRGRDREWKLYCIILDSHAGVRAQFSLEHECTAALLGCSVPTVKKTISNLIEMGLIGRIHKGGSRPGDAHIYKLTDGEKYLLQ